MKICPRCQRTFLDTSTFCPDDASPLQALGAIGPGTILRGKYRIDAELGRGGMGVVWRAKHLGWDEDRALKVLSDTSPQVAKGFLSEARIMRHLRNPHIVQVDDIDQTEEGRPFVLMELIEGMSLRQRIVAQGALAPAEAVMITCQVCEALAHAHGKGVLHRDIKPQNILLARLSEGREEVKLIDFGIAKVREEAQLAVTGMMTAPTGLFLGTPEYASPEQAQGMPSRVLDGRTDLYSLGLVLYEMLTGQLPFKAETPIEMLVARLQHAPAPMETTRPGLVVSRPLRDAVMRALSRDREQRFSSADEMRGALAQALAVAAPAPGPMLPPRRTEPVVKTAVEQRVDRQSAGISVPAWAWSAGAGTLILLGGLAYFINSGERELVPSAAETPRIVRTAEPSPSSTTNKVEAPHAVHGRKTRTSVTVEQAASPTPLSDHRTPSPKAVVDRPTPEVPPKSRPVDPSAVPPSPGQESQAPKVTDAAPEKPVSPSKPPSPIHVGGQVMAAKLIRQPRPVYPTLAKQARIQGTVRLSAEVGTDGTIQSLEVVSGHPLLISAALDAARRWVYQPTMLNGEPVAVITMIDVNFTLSQ